MAAAEAELAARDPVLARLIDRCGPCILRPRLGGRGHFETLAREIAYQQLAGRAAETIWGRARALVPGRFSPDAVLELPEGALRSAGLSGSKARSLADLAARVDGGELRLDRLSRLPDERVVEELSQVRGIGRWTAEMFLSSSCGASTCGRRATSACARASPWPGPARHHDAPELSRPGGGLPPVPLGRRLVLLAGRRRRGPGLTQPVSFLSTD